MQRLKPKIQQGLEMKVCQGKSGKSYLVFRTPKGAFHVFCEVVARTAATDCGARSPGDARVRWRQLWK